MTPKNKAKRRTLAHAAAVKDIRKALRQQCQCQCQFHGSPERKVIEHAGKILVGISQLGKSWCIGSEWYRPYGLHADRIQVWEAFDLFETLGFVYCDQFEDPCYDGFVNILEDIPGKYDDIAYST